VVVAAAVPGHLILALMPGPAPWPGSTVVGGEVALRLTGQAKLLRLLDADEQHPSLRVHELQGDLAGLWSVSATSCLRLTFVRAGQGRKTMVSRTRRYAG
jgi:mRNA-degrading endonuclease YafQ of YafQ-DinJ toxin-antitoxin module